MIEGSKSLATPKPPKDVFRQELLDIIRKHRFRNGNGMIMLKAADMLKIWDEFQRLRAEQEPQPVLTTRIPGPDEPGGAPAAPVE